MRLIDADAIDFAFPLPDNLEGMLKQIGIEMAKIRVSLAPTIEAEPVRHGRWVDRHGGKYANPYYVCSECKGKALYKYEVDVLDNGHFVQALSDACPHCRAKMDVTDINVGNKGGDSHE